MLFSNQHEKTLKNKGFLLIGHGNYTAHLGPHREVAGRESGSRAGLLLLGSRAGPRGLWAYSSLENLKHKSRNLEHWKRNNKWLKGSDVRINQVL